MPIEKNSSFSEFGESGTRSALVSISLKVVGPQSIDEDKQNIRIVTLAKIDNIVDGSDGATRDVQPASQGRRQA